MEQKGLYRDKSTYVVKNCVRGEQKVKLKKEEKINIPSLLLRFKSVFVIMVLSLTKKT